MCVGAGLEPAPTNGACADSPCHTKDVVKEGMAKGHVPDRVPYILYVSDLILSRREDGLAIRSTPPITSLLVLQERGDNYSEVYSLADRLATLTRHLIIGLPDK